QRIAPALATDQERLEHTVRTDRTRQRFDRISRGEVATFDLRRGHHADHRLRSRRQVVDGMTVGTHAVVAWQAFAFGNDTRARGREDVIGAGASQATALSYTANEGFRFRHGQDPPGRKMCRGKGVAAYYGRRYGRGNTN